MALTQPLYQMYILFTWHKTGFLKFLCRHRSSEEKSLDQFRKQAVQTPKFFLIFHTLTADADLRAVCQLQHITQQSVIVGAFLNLADKTAVYFYLIDFQPFQIA